MSDDNTRAARRRCAAGALLGIAGATLLLPAPASARADAPTLRERLATMRAELQQRGGPPPTGYGVPCDGRGGERQAQFQNWPNSTFDNQPFDNWDNWQNY